ncbi:rho GTPase-activating protein 190-like isoform X2 [Limulus polyphemus]|uniref:Rho GTPase-activating protein 190-like isoform X2 n=1 Tax=Limulus polyphemus TaxID=6850 RepID=A0ABM1SK18_LIMPO|nr:rho GTPase-activating protein 190-like isoform X2 [Limulus polyphemus]
MAKKCDVPRTFNIAVVGLSGTEKEKGSTGVGKSCLCNRFVRHLADDYYVDHISVLSQTDFSGRVVNNDHFLYWGEVTKTSDEGVDFHFNVVEQTEFIDDSSFQPFKSGKTDPYYKRCSTTKLTSAEKLMYICKNQLGIEKEYEQKMIPEGKLNIDGFVCVFDVSNVPGRTIEKQVEFTSLILNNLWKTKKPIVLVTTKNDEARESYIKEAERLVTRKEYKGNIPTIETSSHENVNVDLAFFVLAQMIDRTKGKSKVVPFIEAAQRRKEVLDVATEAYQSVIRAQVTDYKAVWSNVSKRFAQNSDFLHYCDLFGHGDAQKMFMRHVKKLKEEYIRRKMQMYIKILPEVLSELLPDLQSLGDGDWRNVRVKIQQHPDFSQYFLESPDEHSWQESDLVDSTETRIPQDILDTSEAETCFQEHKASLEADEKRKEMRKQFKQLLEETGYVTPGKTLSEVRVLFMGRECFEALSESNLQEIYDEHQKEITERAKQNFQELLLENAEIFYHFTSIGPGSVITQEDISKITETLREDSRYKALDRLDQERMLMLLRHLGFVHGPIKEHCPAFPNCMDNLIEKVIAQKAHRPSSWSRNSQWLLESENNQLNLVLLGSGGIADELANTIRAYCTDDIFEMEKIQYTLDFRIIDGDVGLPHNSFRTSAFLPHGCFCVYSNHQTLEYIRESLEKTLLSNLEQEDRLPFHGLPIVILFAADASINEKDLTFLREEGQNRAKSLQCPFIDVSNSASDTEERFDEPKLLKALHSLIESIQRRADLLQIYHTLPEQAANPDIRIIMCMLCGDPYTVEHVLGPLLSHQCCFFSSPYTITLETYLGDCKRSVEVRVTSYHGANAFREELVHGFILVYSTKRKASLSTLSAFSMNIPNIPVQILAVTETGSANAFFSSDLSHQLITEGNAIADKLQAHFMTSVSTCQQKTAFYTPFFKEVSERKPQIEKAFSMDDSDYSLESFTPVPPPVPSRQESYHIRSGSLEDGVDSEGVYEQLPMDSGHGHEDETISPTSYLDDPPLSPSDESDLYTNVCNQENGEHLVKPSQLKNRRSFQADLYHQSFPSTESLDRAVTVKSRDSAPPLPLPLSRFDRESHTGIDLTFPPPPLSTFTGTVASPSSYQTQVHYSPCLSSNQYPLVPGSAHPSLYATGRRRPGAHDPKSSPFPQYSLKKMERGKKNELGIPSAPSAPSLASTQPGPADDLDASDSVTDDDDTLSSGFSGYGTYPPPPEPAPPDLLPSHIRRGPSIPVGHHASRTSLDEVSPLYLVAGIMGYSFETDDGGSQDSLNREPGWIDNRIFEQELRAREWLDNEVYHTYHSRHHKTPPPLKPKPGKQKPGKLNLQQFNNITDAIAKFNLTAQRGGSSHTKVGMLPAPLATPESIDLASDYAQVKDTVPLCATDSSEYAYAVVHNALPDSKPHRVRSLGRRHGNKEAFERAGSDSDSDWSSLERMHRDVHSRVNRKSTPYKKMRKKRGVPVAPPRVPSFEGPAPPLPPLPGGERMMGTKSLNPLNKVRGRGGKSPSDDSDLSDDEEPFFKSTPRPKYKHKRSFRSRRRKQQLQALQQSQLLPQQQQPPYLAGSLQFSALTPDSDIFSLSSKLKIESSLCMPPPDENSGYELVSPKDPAVMMRKSGMIKDGEKTSRKKDKKLREDEKLEKRRLKEEKRLTEKKKKKTAQGKGGNVNQTIQGLESFAQSEDNQIPLFVEKCIRFIEEEGLDSEGIYRVPGNRAHMDQLYQKFDEDPQVSIRDLDIPVNAVATALKDFFSKRLPPLFSVSVMEELSEISNVQDRSCRLFALRDLLKKIPRANFEVLKFVFQHFVRVAENCRLNSMDSKNLAICWWPTLLPLEFNDMGMFERMRPHLEDLVQTMIDQFRFLFCGEEEVVMV